MLVVGLMESASLWGWSLLLLSQLSCWGGWGVEEGGSFARTCGTSIRFEAAVGGWVLHLTSSLFHRPTREQETGFSGRL